MIHTNNRIENHKAQAAVEYMLTYGWMLLAVAVVGGATWQTIGFQCVPSTTGFEGEDIIVDDFAVNQENDLMLLLENNQRQEIELKGVDVSGDFGTVWTPESDTKTIDPGTQVAVEFETGEFRATDEACNEATVRAVFDTGPLQDVETSGKIVAPISGIGSAEGGVPEAPEDFSVS